ncbi:hypothetical protein JZ751_027762 [Albula glossodonta]|uniref:Uncharacterized protein n=1 Tax=Albula glossodonta TaxID=121402 RepID=A0A8T2PAR4_9TELE|nr:hypothetical protein JZ751_027762 [Albula glossodonta]
MKGAFFILLITCGASYAKNNTSAPCKPGNGPKVKAVTEGEALRLPCHRSFYNDKSSAAFSWFREGTQVIQHSEDMRIHHHGAVLFFLPLHLNDTATYSCIWRPNLGQCVNFTFEVRVYKAKPLNRSVLWMDVEGHGSYLEILCPEDTGELCERGNGTLGWYKDSIHIPNMSEQILRVYSASNRDEGIYICICTWKHSQKDFNTSASRRLIMTAPSASYPPIIKHPTSDTETAELGSSKTLVCAVFFGLNIKDFCDLWWEINGQIIRWENRYTENITREIKDNATTYTAILTISSVSKEDFYSEFRCIAMNTQRWVNHTVTLKPRETIYTQIVVSSSVLLVFLMALVVFKYFIVDLSLLFRGVFKMRSPADGKVYDAYVIYQRHDLEKAVEEKIDNFVGRLLPEVLEKKCGYRLFIHGRDDLPGEDHMELIETRMKLSRRLMVILTSGSEKGHEASANPEDYDRQVGLHQALVREELKVILIELEKMHCYSHLPQGLQHLILKSAPLRLEGKGRNSDSPNSRFWKRVRYMMPLPTAFRPTPGVGETHFRYFI